MDRNKLAIFVQSKAKDVPAPRIEEEKKGEQHNRADREEVDLQEERNVQQPLQVIGAGVEPVNAHEEVVAVADVIIDNNDAAAAAVQADSPRRWPQVVDNAAPEVAPENR